MSQTPALPDPSSGEPGPGGPGAAPGPGAPPPYGTPPELPASTGLPGHGTPPPYGTPPGYGTPAPGYGAPPPGYPAPGYPVPAGGYPGAPYGVDPYGRPYSDRSKIVAGILQLFLGGFGAGRWYTGHYGIAIAQLLTCGGLGIWALIDGIVLLVSDCTDAQGRVLRS